MHVGICYHTVRFDRSKGEEIHFARRRYDSCKQINLEVPTYLGGLRCPLTSAGNAGSLYVAVSTIHSVENRRFLIGDPLDLRTYMRGRTFEKRRETPNVTFHDVTSVTPQWVLPSCAKLDYFIVKYIRFSFYLIPFILVTEKFS